MTIRKLLSHTTIAILMLTPALGLATELPEFDCVIEPKELVELSSPVSGILESVLVDRSDLVEKGQVVAKLKSGVEEAQVDLAKQQAAFTGEIESKPSSLGFARRKKKRTEQLYAKKAISFDLLDEVQTDAVLAGAELRQATQNRRLAQLELRRAEETLALRTVRSPISGVVVEKLKSAGEHVEDKPILMIAQLDPLRVEVIVPVAVFGNIKPGMKAQILPEVTTSNRHVAEVTIVDKVIDAASGTFGMRLDLPNPDNQLPGGLRCRLRFLTKASS